MSCSVCIEGAPGSCDCWDDNDREYGERDDDEEPRYPDFGCACENALIVDTVCEGCIEWMREQQDEVEDPTTGTVGP